MNNHQVEIILQYLKMPTNYAVILSGGYGIGKTYFFRGELKPEIEKIPTLLDASRNYRAVHISLFGIKSLEDLHISILFELHTYLKNKRLAMGYGIFKSLARSIAVLKTSSDIDPILDDLEKSFAKSKPIEYKDLLICFDDIDRRGKSFALSEFIGFVNQQVEIEGAKILLIANSDQLSSQEEDWLVMKSKTVGRQIDFVQDFNVALLSMIESYGKQWNHYVEFLKIHIDRFKEFLEANQGNLRNFEYFLGMFHRIFSEFCNQHVKQGEIEENIRKRLIVAMDFTLVICIEHRTGSLSGEILEKLKRIQARIENRRLSLALGRLNGSNKETSDKNEDQFLEKIYSLYIDKRVWFFSQTILDYVLGRQLFSIGQLMIEMDLEELYLKKSNEDTPPDPYAIHTSQTLDMPLSAYKLEVNKILQSIDKGLYKMHLYESIFTLILDNGNPLRLNADKLKDRIIRGINKVATTVGLDPHHFRGNHIDKNREYAEELIEIQKACIKKIEEDGLQAKNIAEQMEFEQVRKLWNSDVSGFFDRISAQNCIVRWKPFWHNFSKVKYYSKIRGLKNSQIALLAGYSKDRFDSRNSTILKPELPFWKGLKDYLESHPLKKDIRKKYWIDMLLKRISVGIRDIEASAE